MKLTGTIVLCTSLLAVVLSNPAAAQPIPVETRLDIGIGLASGVSSEPTTTQRSGFIGSVVLSRSALALRGRLLTVGIAGDLQRVVRANDRCVLLEGTDDACAPDFPSFRSVSLLVGRAEAAGDSERSFRLLAGPAVVWDRRLGVAGGIQGRADVTSASSQSGIALALWINATVVPRLNGNIYTTFAVGIALRARNR